MNVDRDALDKWQYKNIRLYARSRADVLTRLKWWFVGTPRRDELVDWLASNEFTREEEARIRDLVGEELADDEESAALEEAERLVSEYQN